MTYTEKQKEPFPSDEATKHTALRLLLGPFVGLAYVIALPFLAVGTLAVLAGKKLIDGILSFFSYVVSFGWRPTEAYLSGKKKGKKRETKREGP